MSYFSLFGNGVGKIIYMYVVLPFYQIPKLSVFIRCTVGIQPRDSVSVKQVIL